MGKNYALLFAGCIEDQYLEKRYNNDLGYMYKVLLSKKFDVNNIEILYANACNIIYQGLTINTRVASYQNLKKILENYSQQLKDDDHLLIMVSNHGKLIPIMEDGRLIKMASINMWGNEVMNQKEFALLLSSISCKKLILLGQCYGGNFIRENIPNSILISANAENEYSYSNDKSAADPDYDEFFYHFISYLDGSYPGNKMLIPNSDLTISSTFAFVENANIAYEMPQIKCVDISAKNELISQYI